MAEEIMHGEEVGMSLTDPVEIPEGDIGMSLTDEKPRDEKPAEVSQPDNVPDSYEFEGEDAEYNEAVGAVAKELGLSQEKASRMTAAIEEANLEAIYRQSKAWRDELKNDNEIGGAEFEKNLGIAWAVFDKYGSAKEFRQMLAASGVTNCPDFVKMFVRIGKDLGLTAEAKAKTEPRKSLFPNSKMGD